MKTVEVLFWICFVLVFYTYIGYGLLLFLMVRVKEAFGGRREPVAAAGLPEVTLMIAAYNEESVVREKMENTFALDYPEEKLKIVWVTDGSTDRTNERLALYPRAEVVYEAPRRGKTAALNRGIGFVRTPLVIFTDANTMLNREAVREIVRCFADPKVGCVAGEKRVATEGTAGAASGEGLYWKYESKLKAWDSRLCTAVGAAGELFAVRTELFRPMEADTLLDDFILSLRIAQQGYRIAYCEKAYAVEGGSADIGEEAKRKVRIAAGGLQSVWLLRALLNPFRYGMLSFQYVSHRVLRWSVTPVALFLLLPFNIVLAVPQDHLFYRVVLALQILFYLAALAGYALARQRIRNRWLYVPYYFFFMNLNVIRGAFYLYRKKGSGVWEKARRAASE